MKSSGAVLSLLAMGGVLLVVAAMMMTTTIRDLKAEGSSQQEIRRKRSNCWDASWY